MNHQKLLFKSALEAARSAYDAGRLEEADTVFARVCSSPAAPSRAWSAWGAVKYRLGNAEKALQRADRALSLNAKNLQAHVVRCAALVDLERFDEVLTAADGALGLDPDNRSALLNRGTALLRLGRYEEALAAANAVLNNNSNSVAGNVNQGLALHGLKRYHEAIVAFDRALELKPGYLTALVNRAAALLEVGRFADALTCADEALASSPASIPAWQQRGAALLRLDRPEEALDACERVLALRSEHLGALKNKELALLALKRFEEALATTDAVLAQAPGDVGASTDRLKALLGLHRHQEALDACETVLSAHPDQTDALLTKAQALLALKRPAEAWQSVKQMFDRGTSSVEAALTAVEALLQLNHKDRALAVVESALSQAPTDLALRVTRASILLEADRFNEALDASESVLRDHPDCTDALVNQAAAMVALGRCEDALALCDRLIADGTAQWQIYCNRAVALSGLRRFDEAKQDFEQAYRVDREQFEAFRPWWVEPVRPDAKPAELDPYSAFCGLSLRHLDRCDWDGYEARVAELASVTEERVAQGHRSPVEPFRTLSLPMTPKLQLAAAQSNARYMEDRVAGWKPSWEFARPTLSRKVRIGYVSADFRNHPTAHLMRSMFRLHDRTQFEIYVYSLWQEEADNAYQQTIADTSDAFVNLSETTDEEAARKIHGDQVDILVDLMGYTGYSRPEIFAAKPAPLQVSYLGYPGTMGASFIDYIVADPVVLPAELARFYQEKPMYVPDSYQVNDHWQEIAETGMRRSDQGLPESSFVFACFNQAYKIEPVMFDVWMRIMKRVPNSVLWLLVGNPEVAETLQKESEARGVAGDRLIFAKPIGKAKHLERLGLVDLCLDTLIYNAHTTTSDALWAGVPVITCPGDLFASRVAASLLRAVGLPEMIMGSFQELEDRAVRLATQPGELQALRKKLWDLRLKTPLFDTELWVRHLERGYKMMWESHVSGAPPSAIWIPREGESAP